MDISLEVPNEDLHNSALGVGSLKKIKVQLYHIVKIKKSIMLYINVVNLHRQKLNLQ